MTEPRTILLVDQDLDYLDWATKILEVDGIKVLRCDRSDKALQVIAKTPIDLVIADLLVEPIPGLEFLGKIRSSSPSTFVVLTAGFPSTAQIIESTQKGAYDVLRKEALTFELRPVVESALRAMDQRDQASDPVVQPAVPLGKVTILGVSKVLQDVLKVVGRVAHSEAPVLITGESGTGKELVAKAIHDYSPRRHNELLTINCGAIPENLLESELFGHEKGSFTGAMARREGRFEHCHEGTLFLDEVGDLPTNVQVKLLRVLQDGSFSRVGSNEVLKTDVRIVAATNKDLAAEVSNGTFREDLYYRLNVIEIPLPALRERPDDIPILCDHFLQKCARRSGSPRLHLSQEAIELLQNHHWPGNVRELENTITRACALAGGEILLASDIQLARAPASSLGEIENSLDTLLNLPGPLGSNRLRHIQKLLVDRALHHHNQNEALAAESLGVTLSDFRKLFAPAAIAQN